MLQVTQGQDVSTLSQRTSSASPEYSSTQSASSSLATLASPTAGHCTWYGQCHKDAIGKVQNCPYSGPAKPLDNKVAEKTLKKWCPHMFNGDDTSKF
jgi:hypothetical protein